MVRRIWLNQYSTWKKRKYHGRVIVGIVGPVNQMINREKAILLFGKNRKYFKEGPSLFLGELPDKSITFEEYFKCMKKVS